MTNDPDVAPPPGTHAYAVLLNSRQESLLPAACLEAAHAVIVGVGAGGRQTALMLAAAGVPTLTLIDADVVAVENFRVQGYPQADLGLGKVHATADACHNINPRLAVRDFEERFRRSHVDAYLRSEALWRAVFVCVDSMESRRHIWEAVKDRPDVNVLVDGRMNAEVIRLLAVQRGRTGGGLTRGREVYEKSLFSDAEAYRGGCTQQSTIYAASVAAGLAVAQMARALRGGDAVRDQILNLNAAEWAVLSEHD